MEWMVKYDFTCNVPSAYLYTASRRHGTLHTCPGSLESGPTVHDNLYPTCAQQHASEDGDTGLSSANAEITGFSDIIAPTKTLTQQWCSVSLNPLQRSRSIRVTRGPRAIRGLHVHLAMEMMIVLGCVDIVLWVPNATDTTPTLFGHWYVILNMHSQSEPASW